MALSDIPGYVQGWRFSDDPAFYRSGDARFTDLAGYGALNELQVDAGTPTFVTDGGARGVLIDNTWHGSFLPAACWQMSMILVARTQIVGTGSQVLNLILFGNAASVSSNSRLQMSFSSGNRSWLFATDGSVNVSTITRTDDSRALLAFSKSQETRKGYHSQDGVSVTETAAVADNNSGNGLSMTRASAATVGLYDADNRSRFGNLSGTRGDLTVTASSIIAFEAHFFSGSILSDHLAAAATEIAALRTAYGL
jgi:hypothetical protein